MKYTTVDSSNESLYISERGISGTAIREHAKGSLVYKYEFNGFSLTGINTDHQLPSTSLLRTKVILISIILKFQEVLVEQLVMI